MTPRGEGGRVMLAGTVEIGEADELMHDAISAMSKARNSLRRAKRHCSEFDGMLSKLAQVEALCKLYGCPEKSSWSSRIEWLEGRILAGTDEGTIS